MDTELIYSRLLLFYLTYYVRLLLGRISLHCWIDCIMNVEHKVNHEKLLDNKNTAIFLSQ